MIKIRVREVALERNIKTAYQLQKVMGVNPSMAARLWKGDLEMIAFKTIDSLCNALECEPGDLFVRDHDKKRKRER